MREAGGERPRRFDPAVRHGRERRLLTFVLITIGVAILLGGTALGVCFGVVRELDQGAATDSSAIGGRALDAALIAGLIAGLIALAAVAIATVLMFRLSMTLVRRLDAREERYRALFDHVDLGVAVLASDGDDFVFRDFNRAAERIAQVSRAQLIGRRLTDEFPGVEAFGIVELMRRVGSTGAPERLPTRYYRDHRIEGWRDVSVYRQSDEEIVILFADVSSREGQARALQRSEARYRLLVEAQPDPVCRFLPDTTLTFVNRAYARFYGAEPEALVGKRWHDVAPQCERPQFLDALSSFTPQDAERQEEMRTVGTDGQVRWHLYHVHAFFDDAGRLVSFQAVATDITPQKRAEEQLGRQLAMFTAITNSAADAIFVSDRDQCITFMNPAAERIFGWTADELIGRPVHATLHAHGRSIALSECPIGRAHARGETLLGHEDVFFRNDGSPIPVACSSAPLIVDGEIAGSVLVAHDITGRRAAEQALRASEQRLRLFIETAPVPIAMFDCDMRYLAASSRYCREYQLDPDDLLGRSHYEVFPGLPERSRDVFRRCLAGAVERSDGERFETSEGPTEWIRWEVQPWRGRDGEIGGVILFSESISERKRVENALRESEARYRTAGEAIRYGLWVCDARGGVEYVSRSFLELIGRSLDEVRPRGWLDLLPAEESAPTLRAWRECVRTGSEWAREYRVRGTDGAYRTILSLSRPVRDEDGSITSWVGYNLDISSRKRAEEALRASETRLRRAVENAPFPIMVHAEDGQVVHLSQAWLQLTGYTRDEIGSVAQWVERAYVDGKDAVRSDIDELYALDQAVNEGEYVIRCAGGETRIWSCSSAPLGRDERGRRLVVTMAADLTEHKRAERALRESEIRMRALLDASQDEILLLSIRGEILAINKAAERRLARRTGGADLVGMPIEQVLPLAQARQRMAIAREVAQSATAEHSDVPVRSRWFDFWFYPVIEPDRPVTEVAIYAREITEQKRSQAELNTLLAAIQQSPMSVVITDRNGVIEYVNPEFTTVSGYTPAEVIGQSPRLLKSGHTPPEQYEELWATISQGQVWRGEFLNKKKNGELYWELASVAPVKDGETITSFVAVKEDITHRKEIEEQLRQSQKMQAIGQLTGGIAHDFNNLLSIILGNLQLLAERIGDEKLRELIDDAQWSARRGGELTHRLLAFARRQPLKPAATNLNEVVQSMAQLLRRTLGARIRIEETLAPDLWQAFVDRGELERALVNLAVNARDAMDGEGVLTLETRNAVLDELYAEQYDEVTPGEYVLLAATDTGSGMPPDVVNRVFEPFFTTKAVGQGSGLGLSMVYGFVKQSGGHVSIYSRVGYGTSVKLYLPRVARPPLTLKDEAAEELPRGLGGRLVLVVEDEPKLRRVAVKMLERLGLRSLQAETARDALELLADTHVDVLFTDIELPGGMNGTQLADAARDLDPGIKLLFTTGYAREAVLHERWLQEKVPWLLKPYAHQELARELKRLLVPTLH